MKHGYKFISDTDTEVVAVMCKYIYDSHKSEDGKVRDFDLIFFVCVFCVSQSLVTFVSLYVFIFLSLSILHCKLPRFTAVIYVDRYTLLMIF